MAEDEDTMPVQSLTSAVALPRVTIQFCTQCKWMLRATYYAQELLSTFGLAIGEVSLQPSTGGTFIITIHHPSNTTTITTWTSVLWDRKVDGGFPETKELKRRVRDVIEPGRNLGHVDREHARPPQPPQKKDEVKAEDGGGSMDWQQQNANRGGMAVGKNEDGGETAIASSEGVQEGKPTCEDCR